MKKITIILLSLLLIACTKTITVREPYEVDIIKYEAVPVPEDLLQPCSIDLNPLVTNQDLERKLADALSALNLCTADKDAIRKLE